MNRCATLLLASTVVVSTATGPLAGAADAAVPVDCSGGPVVIDGSTESYDLVGVCSNVTVTASDVDITLAGASRLDISGSDVTVRSSGPITAVAVRASTGLVEAPEAAFAEVRGSNVTLRIPRLDSLKLIGSDNRVRGKVGTTAKVTGSDNKVTFTRLATLVVKGAGNGVKVRKGRTAVTVHGAGNVIRVHTSLHP